MGKFYEELQISVCWLTEEVVRTSSSGDPFDDGFTDFGDENA